MQTPGCHRGLNRLEKIRCKNTLIPPPTALQAADSPALSPCSAVQADNWLKPVALLPIRTTENACITSQPGSAIYLCPSHVSPAARRKEVNNERQTLARPPRNPK